MPRKKTTCARRDGHVGPCATAEAMGRNREYRHVNPSPRQTPESYTRSRRKARIVGYGLTEATFAQLLEIQNNACAMCHEPLEEGQRRHIDHDHACCAGKRRSCGKCVRGVLCHTCNIALGHIERRQALARSYLADPPGDLLRAALSPDSCAVQQKPARGRLAPRPGRAGESLAASVRRP